MYSSTIKQQSAFSNRSINSTMLECWQIFNTSISRRCQNTSICVMFFFFTCLIATFDPVFRCFAFFTSPNYPLPSAPSNSQKSSTFVQPMIFYNLSRQIFLSLWFSKQRFFVPFGGILIFISKKLSSDFSLSLVSSAC